MIVIQILPDNIFNLYFFKGIWTGKMEGETCEVGIGEDDEKISDCRRDLACAFNGLDKPATCQFIHGTLKTRLFQNNVI